MSEDSIVTPEVAPESEGLRRLRELEATGEYVFHGGPNVIPELEPRQANNYQESDGEPAVCASKSLNLALFRAIFNAHGQEGISAHSGWKSGSYFYADQVLHDAANTAPGYVHVLLADDFTDYDGRNEVRSTKPVEPIEVIEVHRSDFTLPVGLTRPEDLVKRVTS